MELVYLWVEKYKNIEKQGFNFSPRFRCEYDKESNELIIDENDDFVDIFPKNINITAIVGENGSGKSTLFEIIKYLYTRNNLDYNKKNFSYLIIKVNSKFKIIYNNNEVSTDRDSSDIIKLNKVKVNEKLEDLEEVYEIKVLTKLQSLYSSKPFKELYGGENLLTLSLQFYEMFFNVLKINKDFFSFLNEKFIFSNFQMVVDISKSIEIDKLNIDKELYSILVFKANDKYSDIENLCQFIIKTIYLKSVKENISDKIFTSKIRKQIIQKKEFNIKLIEQLLKKSNMLFKIDDVLEVINLDYEGKQKNKEGEDIVSIRIGSNRFRTNIYDIQKVKIDNLFKDNKLLEYLYNEKLLEFDFFHNDNLDYNFISLSTGERDFIKFLTELAYNIYNSVDDKPIIMFCDEIEVSLHPQWQKKSYKKYS